MTRLIAILLLALPLHAADDPDLEMQTRIRQEALHNSKVMEIAQGLTDFIGPRLTGSPNMKRANDWTRDKLAELGLTNAHLEPWGPFGRSWAYEFCEVRMTSPDVAQLSVLPRAWTPGTTGAVRGKPIHVNLETLEDVNKAKGKLAGKIVLISAPRDLKPHPDPEFQRYSEKTLSDLEQYEMPRAPRATREEVLKRRDYRRALVKLIADEKPLALIEAGNRDFGTFGVQAGLAYKTEEQLAAPSLVMSAEQYNRLVRLVDGKKDIEVEVDVRVNFGDDDAKTWNTIAEIPGTDKKGEVVMLGAHLDSWHGGTGATDNGAGVAATMEAIRVLKAIGIAPKRTIRIALWSGEEQGLLGSRAYVAEHFASRPEPTDPDEKDLPLSMRKVSGPLTFKPEYAKLSAYFNLDNGSGKIRGIYAQENAATRPLFEKWIAPLHDLGVTTVTMRNTGSTDHVSFDAVGLPGFQFIQDEIEYETRTHHTNYDVYERLQRDDLMQAAAVIATFVWEAANRPEMMPRKPVK
jgi:carboxypeptidase Q